MTDVYKAAKSVILLYERVRSNADIADIKQAQLYQSIQQLESALTSDRGEAVISAAVAWFNNWPPRYIRMTDGKLHEAVRAYLEAQAETGEGEATKNEKFLKAISNECIEDIMSMTDDEIRKEAILKLWKPIDTAPRHRAVLVAEPGGGMAVAMLRNDSKRWTVFTGDVIRPTHWMELPEWPDREPASSECGGEPDKGDGGGA